ncbi:hypothetical protein [uncultured Oscillibacter sp.]|uniref:hypothetical protein n=1 Tax=uncultured Oscillibacter sp. TaxID=876091 RepID=UPI0025D55D04|nr:hypothetical protein [uncultured Oscillibacter sp.]
MKFKKELPASNAEWYCCKDPEGDRFYAIGGFSLETLVRSTRSLPGIAPESPFPIQPIT